MNLSSLAYEIIDECKCGPEEFFVLVSSVYPGTDAELQDFIETLTYLINKGLIIATLSGSDQVLTITLDDLKKYVSARKEAGESLDKCPSICKGYRFLTTEKGIGHLKNEDKPIKANTS
jgi:hypothetical protein